MKYGVQKRQEKRDAVVAPAVKKPRAPKKKKKAK